MTRRRTTAVVAAIAGLLVLLHAWWTLSATREMSATYDEPLHITAGVSYWRFGDYRLQPENGNLPQRLAAIGVLSADSSAPPVRGLEEAWRTTEAPRLVDAFLYGEGRDSRAMLVAARRASLIWTLLTALLVFMWARRLWGDGGALFALLLYASSTTMLAHGALATSDMSAAFAFTAAIGAWWAFLERPCTVRLLGSAIVTSMAFLAKFSAVLLPVAYVLALLVRYWLSRPTTGQKRKEKTARLLGLYVLATLVHVLMVVLVVWAAFGWRFDPVGHGMPAMAQYYRLWSFTLPPDGALRHVLDAARDWQLLPEAYIHGFSYVHAAAQNRGAFLTGEFRSTGWWWFFPYAFVVKSSIAELLAFVSAVGLLLVGWRRLERAGDSTPNPAAIETWRTNLRPLVPLACWLLVYGLASVTSRLNIGHRHLLPMYPALFILAGAVVGPSPSRRRVWLACAIGLLAVVESISVRPYYLAAFNAVVGGPSNGWRHLVDSSLDWGQEAPRTAAWLRANNHEALPVYYSLFGVRRAERYGLVGREIAPEYRLAPQSWSEWGAGLYAISATQLQDVYSPAAGPWSAPRERDYQWLAAKMRGELADGSRLPVIDPAEPWGENLKTLERLQFARMVNYLRLRSADARIGHSVFIYRLDAETIAALLGDTPSYLALLDSVAESATK